MTERWVCVHGHFYQPPRENPWLDAIEPQPSAAPYPDWNARITAECYRPNAAARIVDGEARIIRIVDNYERMSFNVGPTLLTWLEREAPDVHRAVVEADVRSRERFGGHGSAMAQAYSHLIMPLATRRDKVSQVRWGIADFRHRFGREPEGMWLPECAVDTESLEVMAAEGILFAVLAPHQAQRVRPPGGTWRSPAPGDTGRVYRCPLPSGRSIDLFFYDGAVAQAVAFERLLTDGGALADRLVAAGRTEAAAADGAVLSHIATDGETYGHHHRYGDMALAYALWSIEHGDPRTRGARLTNYGEHRTRFPATWEVEIVEDSSWSCVHGVARWRENCGCNSGGKPGWTQAWRRPLRDALDWLRDRIADVFEQVSRGLLVDPWAARDEYIEVVLDRSPAVVDAFVARHLDPAVRAQAGTVTQRVLELMELARHAMLMYTSCGWFFDDLSGIETVQILQYAARAIELAERVGGEPIEAAFVDRLASASSNVADEGDGRRVWARRVAPARVDLTGVVAHHAVSMLVDRAAPTPVTQASGDEAIAAEHVYCYRIEPIDRTVRRTGKARLVAGTARAESTVTREGATLSFAALHLGEHHLVGGVKPYPGEEAWLAVVAELSEAFLGADLLAAQRALDRFFEGVTFTLRSLFGAERQRALRRILADTIGAAEGRLAQVYDDNAPLMRYLVNHGLPVPDVFRLAGEQTLRRRVLENLEADTPSLPVLRGLLAEARQVEVELDTPGVAYVAGETLARLIDRVVMRPDDLDTLATAARVAEVVGRMKSDVDLWRAQNQAWALLQGHLATWRHAGDPVATRRADELTRLATALRLAVPAS